MLLDELLNNLLFKFKNQPRSILIVWLIIATFALQQCISIGPFTEHHEEYMLLIVGLVILGSIISIVLYLVFFYFCRCNDEDVLLALDSETDEERTIIEKKFTSCIRESFRGDVNTQYKNVKLLNQYQSKWLVQADEKERNEKLHSKNVRLCFFGNCRIGKVSGKDVYRIKLTAVVLHNPLPQTIQNRFRNEISHAMMPLIEITIPKDDDVLLFDKISDEINLVSDFIKANALFYENKFENAKDNFEEIKQKLDSTKRNTPCISILKGIVPHKVNDCYFILSAMEYEKYRKDKSKEHLTQMALYLDRYNTLCPDMFGYFISLALLEFCLHRNIENAMNCVKKAKKIAPKSTTCQFDEVFLKMYRQYSPYLAIQSKNKYASVFKRCTSEEEREVEEFISDVLEQEPDKAQLNWLLALLANNRGDYKLSSIYCSSFEKSKVPKNDALNKAIIELEYFNGKKEQFG